MELQDIQGLLVRAHGELPEAAYLMLSIREVPQARNWLKDQLPQLATGSQKAPDRRIQLAFTYSGMEKLGAQQFVKHGFSVEYVQGMTSLHKSRFLGDLEQSAPENWQWGGTKTEAIDMVWMLFAADKASLESHISAMKAALPQSGLAFIHCLDTQGNPHQKEHFGFRDGMSQPVIPGLSKVGTPENTVPEGEFILGYKNAYDQFPETPVVDPMHDPENLLAESANFPGLKDFGKNGSYMVFRQLTQDVSGFWASVFSAVKNENSEAGIAESVHLAAKMVGRWPNGKPVSLAPDQEMPYDKEKDEGYLYAAHDADGCGCPFGAHVRRANPRDAMPDNQPASAIRISNRHRILRRGRNFGPPLAASFAPQELIEALPDGQERGLQFICFNSNIQRQFEFIQHSWSNNTKFAGLYSDPDPILGIKDSRDKGETHDFTMQGKLLRRKLRGLRRHVHVIGGAYFFMPGLRALKFLAHFSPKNA